LVIDLEDVVKVKAKDVVLKGGDRLFVPLHSQEVSVLGEVFYPTSHIYTKRQTLKNYIGKSGGYTHRADKGKVYIVRANGEVIPGGNFFSKASILPGDAIVVPMDVDRVNTLLLWTSISQIFYQLGIAAAAWDAVGVF
jgi:protein involved in polysaccharide export with SLBB domain